MFPALVCRPKPVDSVCDSGSRHVPWEAAAGRSEKAMHSANREDKNKKDMHIKRPPQQKPTTDNRTQASSGEGTSGRAVPGEREGRTSVEPAAPAPFSSSSSNSRFSSSPGARIFLGLKKTRSGIC